MVFIHSTSVVRGPADARRSASIAYNGSGVKLDCGAYTQLESLA